MEIIEPEDPTDDNRVSAIARFPSSAACQRAATADLPTAKLGPHITVEVANSDVEAAVWNRMQETQAKRQRQEEAPPPQITMVPGCLLHVTQLAEGTNDVSTLKRVFGAEKSVRWASNTHVLFAMWDSHCTRLR